MPESLFLQFFEKLFTAEQSSNIMIFALKQNLKREHHLKGTLRNDEKNEITLFKITMRNYKICIG